MPCIQTNLAQIHDCRVDQCSCGQLHLSYGSMTLHLSPGRLRTLGACIEQSLGHLSPAKSPEYPPVTKIYRD